MLLASDFSRADFHSRIVGERSERQAINARKFVSELEWCLSLSHPCEMISAVDLSTEREQWANPSWRKERVKPQRNEPVSDSGRRRRSAKAETAAPVSYAW